MLSLVLALVPLAPAIAQDTLTNTVTVTPSSSVVDGTPGNNIATAIVTISTAAPYDFCPAGGENFGLDATRRIWRYGGTPGGAPELVPELSDSGASDDPADSLMVDAARNRLLFVRALNLGVVLRVYDAGSGGWVTGADLTGLDIGSMAAMTSDGTGYMISSSAAPTVFRIDAVANSSQYTVTNIGSLSYDEPPTVASPGDGDLAFDADGIAWIVIGKSLYSVDLPAGELMARKRADLSDIPAEYLTGASFTADNRLLLAPEYAGSIGPAYFLYDVGSGEITEGPTGDNHIRDLASCAFPRIASEPLTVTKTLVQVNSTGYVPGEPVRPGDTLTYNIHLANGAGTVTALAPGDVIETLPDHTAVVAIDNDFTCSGSTTCPNTVATNVPAGGSIDLRFMVAVLTTVPAGTTTIDNHVSVTDVDCNALGNDCEEVTPLAASVVTVSKSSDVGNGTPVKAEDTITYTVTVSVANAATNTPVVVTDTLGNGLTFDEIVSDSGFVCTTASDGLECTLPTGTPRNDYEIVYTATVDQDANTSVSNSVVTDTGTCTACTTTNPLLAAVMVAKTADPASGNTVRPTETIEYTLTVTVANAATSQDLVLEDTLSDGLTFDAVTSAGDFVCNGALTCTLLAGADIGTYVLTYNAQVNPDAVDKVNNSVEARNAQGGDPDPVCTSCTTEHNIVPAKIVVTKSANPATGSTVAPGDTIEYTLMVTVAESITTEAITLEDTLGAGLTFKEVTSAVGFDCNGELTCVLPEYAELGPHVVTYTATVDANAVGTVGNTVTATNPQGGDPEPECATCTTEHKIVPTETTVTKTANPATGSTVLPGDTIEYTLTVTVANSTTTEDITLADVLGDGLSFDAVTSAGAFACSGELDCTLPSGTDRGVYAITYTAKVDPDATGTVGNTVTATNPQGGDPDPTCATCATEHQIKPVAITVVKSADPAAGAEVRVGDTIAYTVAVTVANSATTQPFTLTDTLGPGLAFGAVTDAGAFTCSGTLECVLPVGTLPGLYEVAYTATVGADAKKQVLNQVAATGGGGDTPDCSSCSVEHLLADPKITISKSSNPGSGAEVRIGDTIEYTLTALVENSSTLDDAYLIDAPGVGLDIGTLPAGCTRSGDGFRCALPAGTVPGATTFTYTATVSADAGDNVVNLVTGESAGKQPECGVCETTHKVVDDTSLRITKTVSARTAKIGDLLRYTLTIENVGTRNLANGTVLDTPPAGFSYVEGSMSVADGDGAFNLGASQSPLRIEGLDIAVGEQATVVYLLRVGAGVRPGVYINEAVAVGIDGEPVSNVATAQVIVDSDPLLDDSLVFGTVFDDRDGDGWQDSAELDGVRVQGGFAADAYIAGSTTVDRGQGPVPQADASAPLLHGIEIGKIEGRGSIADTSVRQVVIRQRLRELAFDGDFVLTSAQGLTLRMDAAGDTTIVRSGDAIKGIGAGEPTVERRVAQVEGGYEVSYAIGNAGIDERGIPGVRVASVEGLLIETDQYGRFHLIDVQGGEGAHGRNFILKVDPATLPPQTVFTTENPLVRRITPGVPVRFGFGVKLPVQEIPGSTQRLELQLGEVIFAPDSAEVRARYMPAIAKMAEQVDAHGGGEVVITAEGGNEALAFARAEAVRDALVAKTSEAAAKELNVVLRTKVDDPHSLVAMVGGSETLLGTVLFDTDRSTIRPEFEGLLDSVARRLEEMGGGAVGIVGHTDVRAPHAYNTALGLRRAQSVFDALAKRLSPAARAHLRVQSSNDPNAPLGTEQK